MILNRISRDFLRVADQETRSNNIILQLISLEKTPFADIGAADESSRGRGEVATARLVHLNEPGRAVRAFSMRDYVNGKIAFQKVSLGGDGNYIMKLRPMDTHFEVGRVVPVLLQCRLEENLNYQIFVKPVYIYSGGAVQLRPDNIQTGLNPTATVINFKIRKMPRNGHLRVNGDLRSSFNSNHLLAALRARDAATAGLTYSHNDGLSQHDKVQLRAMYKFSARSLQSSRACGASVAEQEHAEKHIQSASCSGRTGVLRRGLAEGDVFAATAIRSCNTTRLAFVVSLCDSLMWLLFDR